MSSPLQTGGPGEGPRSAIRLRGSLGGQAKVRRQPPQHIPARVSASLSLSPFPPRSKHALLPALPLSQLFWVVMLSSGGKWWCSSGGIHELLRGVLLTPAPHPRCLPALPSDLPAALDRARALAGDPPQTSLVLLSPFIPLHPPVHLSWGLRIIR